MADSPRDPKRRVAAGAAAPFIVANPGGASDLLLLGDHAGAEIPPQLGDLGLSPSALEAHIAVDIGVAALGARLAQALDAVFIAQRYSRLVIDCNRDPGRPDSICEVGDGIVIPGNAALAAPARQARIDGVFAPYHARIAAELDARVAAGRGTLVAALHSFTPVMAGAARPWRFGVLHMGGSAFSNAVLAALRAVLDPAVVGDNQPYRMDGTDYTIPHHAIGRGLDYVELEVRQDLIAAPAGQAEVAAMLAPILAATATAQSAGKRNTDS